MKIFISVPMKDRTNKEISSSLEQMKRYSIEKLKDQVDGELEFIDNFVDIKAPDGVDIHILRIGEDIKQMAKCDIFVQPDLAELDLYSYFRYDVPSCAYYKGIYTEDFIWRVYKPEGVKLRVPMDIVLTNTEFEQFGKRRWKDLIEDGEEED